MEFLFSQYTYIELSLVAIMILSFIVVIYYLFQFLFVVNHRHVNNNDNIPKDIPVTIVVVVGDDLFYLENSLIKILTQKYDADYQVVVVSDTPTMEEGIDMLKRYQEIYPHLYVTTIKEDVKFKHTIKLAKTIGIKAAIYDNILFTDAKCTPASDKWLSFMSMGFVSRKSIVVGYSRVEYKQGLTNVLERIDNIRCSLLMLSKAIVQKTYMVQGANSGITKDLFFESKGYTGYLRLNKGDNDLFIQRVNSQAKTSVLLNPSASVVQYPVYSFSNWYNRRKSNTYTHRYYQAPIKRYLFMNSFSNMLFWFSSISLIVLMSDYLWMAVVAFILMKLIFTTVVLKKLKKRTKEKIPYLSFYIYDIIEPIDTFLLYVSRTIKPSKGIWI